VGQAIRHGNTLHIYRWPVILSGVKLVMARPQCTPPKNEIIVAPYPICKTPACEMIAGSRAFRNGSEAATVGLQAQNGKAPPNPRTFTSIGTDFKP